HDGDAPAVDIASRFEMIDGGGKRALGSRLLAEQRVLARPRHVDRNGREPKTMQRLALPARILLPAVDAAPVHDDGRPRDPAGYLEIDHDLFAFERNFDPLDGCFEIAAGLEIRSHRAAVAADLFGAARHRVPADAKILVGEVILFARCARALFLRLL